MSWRIQEVEIKGFKFFKDSFHVIFDGKHVLLYGENGSGKSSIYWSLYTIFQSCLKTQDEAQKYFRYNHEQNLRNRFCQPEEDSGISVTFVDDTRANFKIVEISDKKYPYTNMIEKKFMEESMMSSDFMNYKFLQKIFDFPNSQKNDVFEIFEKEVFKYLQFSKPLVDLQGNMINAFDAETWWKYIQSIPPTLPRNTGKNKNTINMGSPSYKAFIRLIDEFNSEMRNALISLRINTETIIERDFGNTLGLQFEYIPVSFNNIRSGFSKSRDGLIHVPRIILKASMTGSTVVDGSPIHHPKSFFNEAKLTCASLALRLAILGTKPTFGVDYASVLLIDDMLISLDMCYRRKIIDVILHHSEKRQLVILTHDRSFFSLVQSAIEKKKDLKQWKMLELCYDEEAPVPSPKLIECSDLIDKSWMFYYRREYPACANTLRRAYENVLKRILPSKYVYAEKMDNQESPYLNLNGLIDKMNKFRGECEGFPELAPNLNNDRRLILNPFSHDDLDTPLFKSELRDSIQQLEMLSRVKKEPLVGSEKIYVEEYEMKMINNGNTSTAQFVFLEEWCRWEYEGTYYYGNPKVRILKTSSNIPKIKNIVGLNTLHQNVRNSVSLNKDTAPVKIDCITEITSGKKMV